MLQHEVESLYNRKPMMRAAVDWRMGCGGAWYRGGYYPLSHELIGSFRHGTVVPLVRSGSFEESEVAL